MRGGCRAARYSPLIRLSATVYCHGTCLSTKANTPSRAQQTTQRLISRVGVRVLDGAQSRRSGIITVPDLLLSPRFTPSGDASLRVPVRWIPAKRLRTDSGFARRIVSSWRDRG